MKKGFVCLLGMLLCLTGCQAAPKQPTMEQPASSQTVASTASNMDEPEDTVTPGIKVTQLEDGLSTIRFEGDSGFDTFLEQGGAASDWEVAQYLTALVKENISLGDLLFGCSTLSVANANGGYLFGRNFDWEPCNAMVVQSAPENGYKSISTVNTDFITMSGVDLSQLPDKYQALICLYAPLDGMNEKGLVVSVNMIQDSATINQNTGKPGLTTTTAIRLLLDKAASVDEALELLGQYDMHASMGYMMHLAIADNTGRSVVVEYICSLPAGGRAGCSGAQHVLACFVTLITHQKLVGSGIWRSWTVGKILSDEVYTGDMVQGKYEHVDRKQTPAAREKWVVVRDTHEPLVSREMFAKVQHIREKAAAKYTQSEQAPYTPNILKGRIFCGHCGKSLHRVRGNSRYYYRCITNDRQGKGSCPGDIRYLLEIDLFSMVLAIVRQKADVAMDNALHLKQESPRIVAQKRAVDAEIAALQKEAGQNRKFIAGLHETYVSGLLTRDEFVEMKEGYSRKFEDAVERVQHLQEQQNKLEKLAREYTSLAEQLKKIDGNT